MQKSVIIIGGGVAGLASAVFLANKGFNVKIFEAAPKLGGRTYSFLDKSIGDCIDNGQHILASWYKNTFEYLKIIGSYDKLYFQTQLEVNFINQKAQNFSLKASKLPPPLHLLMGLLSYKAIKLKDRAAAIRLINDIKSNKISEKQLKEINANILFNKTGQTTRMIENFWKPFIIAVFNSQPENTSAFMFSEIIKTGFLEKDNSNLVLPNVFLSKLLVEPAIEYITNNNGKVILNKRISKISIKDKHLTSIIAEDNTEIISDFYICAVPFFEINNLMSASQVLNGKCGLFPSPIVNIHLKFEKDLTSIIKNRFYGILESTIQWVFRVKNDQLCIVISSAKEIAEMENNKIILLSRDEIIQCFPELINIKVTGARVIKEMRATFIPDKESLNRRPDYNTNIENLYLAGDWINTGLPATIESAVRSARMCANEIISKTN